MSDTSPETIEVITPCPQCLVVTRGRPDSHSRTCTKNCSLVPHDDKGHEGAEVVTLTEEGGYPEDLDWDGPMPKMDRTRWQYRLVSVERFEREVSHE